MSDEKPDKKISQQSSREAQKKAPQKTPQKAQGKTPAKKTVQKSAAGVGKSKARGGGKPTKTSRKSPNVKARPRPQSNGLIVFVIALCTVLTISYVLVKRGPMTVMGVNIDLVALKDRLLDSDSSTPKAASGGGSELDNINAQKQKAPEFKKVQPLKPEEVWYNQQFKDLPAPQEITGRFLSFFGSKQFELYMEDGIYQIIFSRLGKADRFYSIGRYGFKNGVLAFLPDPSMGPPPNPDNAYRYKAMPDKVYTVGVSMLGPYIHWKPGPQVVNGVERVVKHPMFHYVDANRIIWQPLEKNRPPALGLE